jgi:hypothetical protein
MSLAVEARSDEPPEPAHAGDPDTSKERVRRRWQLLILAALALKTLYLVQYLALPFLFGPLFDSQVYLLQARRIAEGRLGDATLLAFSPLYGYFLALLGAGQASILPVLVQLLLGGLNLLLVRRITARWFGETAGLSAAILYLGYAPLLFFESKIMSETLGLTLLLGTLALSTRAAFLRGEAGASAAAGACFALALLTRASLLLTGPLLALASALPRAAQAADARRKRAHPGRFRALWFSVALALVLLAHGGWTKLHSGLFVPVILVSGTASRATQQTWTGDLSVFKRDGEQAVGAFSVVDQARARLSRARRGEPERAGEPLDLAGYLRQVPHKLWLTLRDRETSFDYGFYGERTEVWILRVLPVSFGMLLSFGGIGLLGALGNRKLRASAPLLAIALGTLLTTTLFHPSTRYRLPLVIALLPLAGYAWQLALGLPNRRSRLLSLSALSAIALTFGVVQALRPLDNPAFWQLRVAEAALEEGDFATVRKRLASARALAPADTQVRERADMLSARLPRRVGQ